MKIKAIVGSPRGVLRGDNVKRAILIVISIAVVVFLIGLVVWNIYQGHPIKEIGMPGGGSVKFNVKGESAGSSGLPINNKQKANKPPTVKKDSTGPKLDRDKTMKDGSRIPKILLEQHTEGNQSPIINSDRDAIINYGNK